MNQLSSAPSHWVLLGTAPASEEVWGLRRIDFPCGYHMSVGCCAAPDRPLERPFGAGGCWAMGGFAFEVAGEAKSVASGEAAGLVAGYRPWLALFHDVLLDELTARRHTITVWDQGVSIFYGLWRQDCQALGELIPVPEFDALAQLPVELRAGGVVRQGSPAVDYAYDAATVIHFMSQFITLSAGDRYVLGPLVAQRLEPGVDEVALAVGERCFAKNIMSPTESA